MFDNFVESNDHFLEMLTENAYNKRVIPNYLSRLQVTDANGRRFRIMS